MDKIDHEFFEEKSKLLGSLKYFTEIFYKLRTGRFFDISYPINRESHFISIFRELVKVFNGETSRLIINVPPRYGKTESLIHFVAWALANYPQSNFIYVSYSHSLAKKQTQTIREIINLPHYRNMFDVKLKDDTQAKDNFELIQGGSVYASGSGGTITGRGAGVKGAKHFSGCVILDDAHKPDEVTSDVMREGVIDWYYNTLQSRVNGPNVPIIYIGQRLHEDDLPSRLYASGEYTLLSLSALDDQDNALYPEMHTKEMLHKMQSENPYVFSSQYQQNPQPAGGGLFKPEWFKLHEEEPEILTTFITADTAETEKSYNDASVFSFWGVYKIKHGEVELDEYAIHLIDCWEIRIEPKDLQNEFLQFYYICMRHQIKPQFVAIEKKSTGVTLTSTLKTLQGIRTIEIERSGKGQSKTSRFLQMQEWIAKGYISLPMHSKHTVFVLEHMRKITANNTHRFDDICDTMYDAIKSVLIDKIIINQVPDRHKDDKKAQYIMQNFREQERLRLRNSQNGYR